MPVGAPVNAVGQERLSPRTVAFLHRLSEKKGAFGYFLSANPYTKGCTFPCYP